jgi:hypothetical protein
MSTNASRPLDTKIGLTSPGWTQQPGKAVRVFDSSVETPSPRAARGLVQRRNGRLRRRRTIYLPPDIDRELSVFCASNGREVSETIAHALVLYLERRR